MFRDSKGRRAQGGPGGGGLHTGCPAPTQARSSLRVGRPNDGPAKGPYSGPVFAARFGGGQRRGDR
eukprot:506846-Lingulodinium_polyedra.AAC.1